MPFARTRPLPLPLVPPEGSLNALAPQSLSRAWRSKKVFSGSPREASRCHQGRGTSKRSRPHPGRGLGGSEGLGGAEPRGNYLKSRGASTKMRTSPKVRPGAPRPPQGAPPPDPFKNPKPARSAQTPPQPGDAPGAQGRGSVALMILTPQPPTSSSEKYLMAWI